METDTQAIQQLVMAGLDNTPINITLSDVNALTPSRTTVAGMALIKLLLSLQAEPVKAKRVIALIAAINFRTDARLLAKLDPVFLEEMQANGSVLSPFTSILDDKKPWSILVAYKGIFIGEFTGAQTMSKRVSKALDIPLNGNYHSSIKLMPKPDESIFEIRADGERIVLDEAKVLADPTICVLLQHCHDFIGDLDAEYVEPLKEIFSSFMLK